MSYVIEFGYEYRRQLGLPPSIKFSSATQAYQYGIGRYGSADYNGHIAGMFYGWKIVQK